MAKLDIIKSNGGWVVEGTGIKHPVNRGLWFETKKEAMAYKKWHNKVAKIIKSQAEPDILEAVKLASKG